MAARQVWGRVAPTPRMTPPVAATRSARALSPPPVPGRHASAGIGKDSKTPVPTTPRWSRGSKAPKEAKFYVVKRGRKPGIYATWPEAQEQVKGVANSLHKSFATRAEASAWFEAPATATASATAATPVLGGAGGAASAWAFAKTRPPLPQVVPFPLPMPPVPVLAPSPLAWGQDGDVDIWSAWPEACEAREDHATAYIDVASAPALSVGIGIWFGDRDPRNVSERLGSATSLTRGLVLAALEACDKSKRATTLTLYTSKAYLVTCEDEWRNWKLRQTQSMEPIKPMAPVFPNADVIQRLHEVMYKNVVRIRFVTGESPGARAALALATKAACV